MSTYGDFIMRGSRPEVGVGVPMSPDDFEKEVDVFYKQWQSGLNVAESPESISDLTASNMSDTEIDDTDALIRAPGITLDEDVTPRSPRYIFQQAAVDFSTELVIIDPPYVGHKSTSTFTFDNLTIANTGSFGWAAADVGGVLIFSNGVDATYTRDPNASTVTDISTEIIAQCFATAFGRTFAGAFVDSITGIQSLAIAWNAASGDVADWSGTGAGAEFLISNNPEADRIVSMQPIGQQTLGIICRKSLWAGYPTGDSNRPADFQLRFQGLGGVSRDSVTSTPYGIMYLSDSGVCLYDLNGSQILSQEINGLLLPLDYTRIDDYLAIFDGTKQRYILNTPFRMFIYEFPHQDFDGGQTKPGRWLVRSFVAQSMVNFTDQTGNVFWNTVIGPWNLQTLSWAEMSIGEADAPSIPFFTKGTMVGFQDYGATNNFDGTSEESALDPFWTTPQNSQNVTDIFETHAYEIQYRSVADAEISISATNTAGALVNTTTKTLPNTSNERARRMIFVNGIAGMGTELKIAFGETAICAIERIRRTVMKSGPAIDKSL